MLPVVVLSDRAQKRLKGKHPWIFSNEIESKPEIPPGEIVRIQDRSGAQIAVGYYNPQTLIAVRILTFRQEFNLKERMDRAIEFRKRTYDARICRLIYSESDGLPGLIVDRYGDTLVVQILTAGMDKMQTEILTALQDLAGPARILFRNDSPYRKLEGLDLTSEWKFGEPIDLEVLEIDGLKFEINYSKGQKTGFFLDQRENRKLLAKYGSAETMLDAFAYTGSWSVYGAQAGIASITAVDSSRDALDQAQINARLNGYNITTIVSEAVPFLRKQYDGNDRYDRIVLDPPAFCKSKKQLEGALRGYREINLRAMKLLRKDGVLFTCSCSQPVSPDLFLHVLQQAAADSGRSFFLREFKLQPPDHPILLNFPESLYLKCAVLQLA